MLWYNKEVVKDLWPPGWAVFFMEIKHCKYCSKEFSKPENVGNKLWAKRQYCQRSCVDNYQRTYGGWTRKSGHAKCSTCEGDMSYYPGTTATKHVKKRICMKCRKAGKGIIGTDHYNYKNYLTKGVYNTPNQAWSKRIKDRDEWKCVVCKSKENLQANHIKPRLTHPEKSLEIENGVTLCRDCHWLFHTSWIGFSYPYIGGTK